MTAGNGERYNHAVAGFQFLTADARAYFNYYFGNKADPKTPSLIFGKMQNPFWRGPRDYFMWDGR